MPRRGRARIGCSGYAYDDWRGPVYPAGAPARTWLGLYAERFDAVELNTTFYRLPTVQAVDGWRDQVPPGFCFAVKVGRFGTHRKKLLEPEWWLVNHLERVRHLSDRLGPNLFQLPPRWRRDVPRLDHLLAVARALGPEVRWAVEVRDPSVKNEEQYEALEDKGMSKERAARIANSPGASKRGGQKSGSGSSSKQGGTTAQKKEAGRKGGKATARKS